MPDPKHPTCIDTSTIGEAPGTSWVCGPGCPRPAGPDPARDARIDAYRDRERRRAARALDRYCELMFGGDLEPVARRTAGERFVEQVGDYVLARLGGTGGEFCGNRVEHQPHPWSDYGVPKRCDGVPQHNGDYGVVRGDDGTGYVMPAVGVPRCPVDGQWCSVCRIGGGNGTGGMCARQERPACDLCRGKGVIDQDAVDFSDRTRKQETVNCPECNLGLVNPIDYGPNPCAGGRCPDPEAHAEGAHDL